MILIMDPSPKTSRVEFCFLGSRHQVDSDGEAFLKLVGQPHLVVMVVVIAMVVMVMMKMVIRMVMVMVISRYNGCDDDDDDQC